jgi:hypothetical protein
MIQSHYTPTDTTAITEDRWRVMRGHLRAAATLAQNASEATTTQDVHKFLGKAMSQLMDADFCQKLIDRDNTETPLGGLD